MCLPSWQLDSFPPLSLGAPVFSFPLKGVWKEELWRGASEATFHVTRQLENQNSGSSFAPPRWDHVAEPWWMKVRPATPQRFMIKAYYVGKLTLIADLNHWNQLICQHWIESMFNSVCHSDRLDGKKPSTSEGAKWMAGTLLCLEVVKKLLWVIDSEYIRKRKKVQKNEIWRARTQKAQPLIWVIDQNWIHTRHVQAGVLAMLSRVHSRSGT